jgi:multidrug efflux pump subunit AcrB
MWIVRLALRQGYTFIVLAISIIIFGGLSIYKMAIDIFPTIDTPVVSCVWTYTGMSPYFMENLVTTVTERALTSTINGIQRMESSSLSGMSVIKIYLQKGTPVGESVAMVSSVGTAILRQLPRGISPPFVTRSSATDVPVIQLSIHSETMSESELFDIANNLIRTQLATVKGALIPFPYGGKYRQVMVDLDPQMLRATGLSAHDVIQAINDQNIVSPDGTAKLGSFEYIMVLNNMPKTMALLNDVPIKTVKGAVVFLKDVAQVHDGYQPQLNIVNLDGKRGLLFNVLKSGNASTLSVVQGVKEILPRIRSIVPAACEIDILVDQSLFVRECVSEVFKEALTAGLLTAVMMLALLGSWRSTLIVATSIPLAILASIIGLNLAGQTINSMTLGGLALAVGMLVDDATVEVENVHRNMAMGKDIETAILDGAEQVALPALVSTLSICIVFVPLLFLTEPSKSLFVPLGMAVTFAMLASYGLSRTIVPLMSKHLLAHEHESKNEHGNQNDHEPNKEDKSPNWLTPFIAIHKFIDNNFEALREQYQKILAAALDHPKLTLFGFLSFYALSLSMLPLIGEDYFPTIDGGALRLHVSAHSGTRVEETERIFKKVEKAIRQTIPAEEIESISQNIGLPMSGINYAYSDSQTVSEADGEIIVTLKEKRAHNTEYYQRVVRKMMQQQFRDLACYFQPGDIVTQILNAGLPAPIDIRVLGMHRDKNYEIAKQIKREVERVPGAADVCLHQVVDAPHLKWQVDRVRADEVGVTQEDISNAFSTSLSSSFQTNPNFWLNAKNGVAYNLAAQTPQRSLASMSDINLTTITPALSDAEQTPREPQLLMNLATMTRAQTAAVANHLNVQPVFDIYAACQGRDLGGVAKDIKVIVDRAKAKLPNHSGTFIFIGGQVMSMKLAFVALIFGLAFALLLVYFLLVMNFQSWTDPLIILMAIPGALSGIVWSLFVTQTTFSIPALMGTIMTMGVASANSILMITFAKEQLAEHSEMDAKGAALSAGYQRFRPVIMTATAMIIGMIPMAIGGGQGGSQNAPIGRAVIGGLLVATLSTLIFVPLIFSLARKDRSKKSTGLAHVDS